MANFELEGKLVQKAQVQRGNGRNGAWAKQDFLVEFVDGKFPATACFNVWGEDKVSELAQIREGEQIKVSFRISSREFNGKYYTDLRAWRIDRLGAAKPQQSQQQAPAPIAPPEVESPFDLGASLNDEADDLPF